MNKTLFPFITATLLAACAAPEAAKPIGGGTDAHGCLPSAGQSWSVVKQQCVQPFNVADIRLEETRDGTVFGIYVILSDDKQQAEIFAVSLPPNTVLRAVKGGYASADGNIRLLRAQSGWRLVR